MAWSEHTPYKRPPNWRATRQRIWARDQGICWVCRQAGATEVDHIKPVSQGGTHDDRNLALIHVTCHKRKTAAEANDAIPKRKRKTETHPGII